jgi:predicted Zn-dependent peptidase
LYASKIDDTLLSVYINKGSEVVVYTLGVQRLRKDVDSLEKQLAVAKKQLEEETITRVDLENRIQSLKEELAFNRQVHQQVCLLVRHIISFLTATSFQLAIRNY